MKAYLSMLDPSSRQAPGHGKAHSSALIAATRRMPWKANGPAESRFCSQRQPITIVASRSSFFLVSKEPCVTENFLNFLGGLDNF